MSGYRPETYGERIADIYDDRYPDADPAMIDRLEEMAAGGPALELAIGTGRVALPLAARGVRVHGIDVSPAMVQRLHAKPGGADIPVTIGDMSELDGLGPFRLVFVVFNSFFALLTQEDQLRCFESVAGVLEEGGRFVIEAFVPDVTRYDRGQRVRVVNVTDDGVGLDVSVYDSRLQQVTSQHLIVTGDQIRMFPVQLRFAYPPELDLMARMAGMRLASRWGGWSAEPYTGEGKHVSVWER